MNSQSMVIDPSELVIDLPIDEAKVNEYMESLSEHGLIQPITVHLQDNRIIDGFHRVVAAVRLGWLQIDAFVRDCDDEAFWNARIISARQHHKIEDERLVAWIFECWKQTKWYVPVKPDDEGLLPRAYSSTNLDITLLEKVWTVFRLKSKGVSHNDTRPPLTTEDVELREWLESHAKQWGMPVAQAVKAIMDAYGFKSGIAYNDNTYDAYACKYNLEFRQALKLQKEMQQERKTGWGHGEDGIDKYARYLAKVDEDSAMGATEYFEDENRAKREEAVKKAEQYASRIATVKHTPTVRQVDEDAKRYQEAQAARKKRDATLNMLKEVRNWIKSLEHDLTLIEDGQPIFAAFITDMVHVHERLWPSVPTGNETADHYRQVYALEQEIKSLRRALGTNVHVTADHVALSSSEVKKLPA